LASRQPENKRHRQPSGCLPYSSHNSNLLSADISGSNRDVRPNLQLPDGGQINT
jgi:hypothetical protein